MLNVKSRLTSFLVVVETYSSPLFLFLLVTDRFQREGVLTRFLPTRGVLPGVDPEVGASGVELEASGGELEASGVVGLTAIVDAQALELNIFNRI